MKIFERTKSVPKIEEFISDSIGIRTFNEKKFREKEDREKRESRVNEIAESNLEPSSRIVHSCTTRQLNIPDQQYLMSTAMNRHHYQQVSEINPRPSNRYPRNIFHQIQRIKK